MLTSSSRKASRRVLSEFVRRSGRSFHSNAALYQAVPAVITTPQTSGGLLSRIFGGKQHTILPPMSEPLPGVREPPPFVAPEKISTELTTFSNGFRVASENTPGPGMIASLYLNCGSMYENEKSLGATHLLEKMAFKSTLNRSHFRLVRELEAIGSNSGPSIGRDVTSYSCDGLKSYLPEVLEILADSVLNPAFHEWEVKEQIKNIQNELKNLPSNPQALLYEALHATAFSGPLSYPLLADPSRISKLTPEILREFVEENYTAPKMVLSVVGADHEELVSLAKPLFSTLPKVKTEPLPASEYIGGDWRVAGVSEFTQVLMGFEVKGGWSNDKDSVISNVVQLLMGGGGSFSAGGPGKGLYSRLYTNVLRNYADVEACNAFSCHYDTTGVIGVALQAAPNQISGLCGVITQELLKLSNPQTVSVTELERAKNATIGMIRMYLESKTIIAEDTGRQVLTQGYRKDVSEYLEIIKSITTGDVTEFSQKFLSTPLTMVSFGEISQVPRYDMVAQCFT